MRKIEVTTAFKRDFKRESKGQHRAILDTELKDVIALLVRTGRSMMINPYTG